MDFLSYLSQLTKLDYIGLYRRWEIETNFDI